MINNNDNYFDKIPAEILWKICVYLNFNDLCSLGRTNKRLYSFVHELLSEELTDERIGERLKSIIKDNKSRNKIIEIISKYGDELNIFKVITILNLTSQLNPFYKSCRNSYTIFSENPYVTLGKILDIKPTYNPSQHMYVCQQPQTKQQQSYLQILFWFGVLTGNHTAVTMAYTFKANINAIDEKSALCYAIAKINNIIDEKSALCYLIERNYYKVIYILMSQAEFIKKYKNAGDLTNSLLMGIRKSLKQIIHCEFYINKAIQIFDDKTSSLFSKNSWQQEVKALLSLARKANILHFEKCLSQQMNRAFFTVQRV